MPTITPPETEKERMMKTTQIRTLVMMTALILLATPALAGPFQLISQDGPSIEAQQFGFDVAENALEFTYDQNGPVFEDGMPAFGNPFITHGYIYPKGFLDGNDGVDDNGQPTFPENVIGEWYCRGYLIGDGMRTESGPLVHTTQTYSFYSEPGYAEDKDSAETMIVTIGYELVDLGVPIQRPVTSGTGEHSGVIGESTQTLIGFDELGGFNLRFDFDVLSIRAK